MPTQRMDRLERHSFGADREVAVASLLVFLRALREAEKSEQDVDEAGLETGGGGGGPPWVLGDGALAAPPSGQAWLTTAVDGRVGWGSLLGENVRHWVVAGDVGLVEYLSGKVVSIAMREVDPGDEEIRDDDDANGAVELDARVMAIRRASDGRRSRAFRETVGDMMESTWENWPIQGPRTLLWCLRHIAEHDYSPLGHHSRFRQIASLQHYDAGVQVHEMAMRVLEHAVTYDQVQAGELACLEVVPRQAQLVELKHRDRVLANQTSGTAPVSLLEIDDHLYLGSGHTRGLLMIDPRLEDFVATELQRKPPRQRNGER